jgi:hypothetical protein
MKFKSMMVILTFFTITSTSPSVALFGLECRAPKSSFTEQLKLWQKLKKEGYYISPKDQAAYDQKRKNKKLIDLPPEPPWDTRKLLRAEKAMDTAYRIVLNNQKCFSPVLVVTAQRYLGK